MSKMSHTPGPWKFGYTDNLEYPLIIGADDEVVCVMRGWVSIKDGNLLAMAPELLEALKLIANAENSALDLAYCKGIARAAIAKATGGST